MDSFSPISQDARVVCRSLILVCLSSFLSGRTYGSVRKDLENRVYATDEARSYAISKAEDLEQELDSSFPIFIKPTTQSASPMSPRAFSWSFRSTHFCRKYLPQA